MFSLPSPVCMPCSPPPGLPPGSAHHWHQASRRLTIVHQLLEHPEGARLAGLGGLLPIVVEHPVHVRLGGHRGCGFTETTRQARQCQGCAGSRRAPSQTAAHSHPTPAVTPAETQHSQAPLCLSSQTAFIHAAAFKTSFINLRLTPARLHWAKYDGGPLRGDG